MAIRVRFFASLREQMGYSEKLIPADGVATVRDVLEVLDNPEALKGAMLCAVNMQYAKAATPVHDGDEVAFFPPVTGGNA